MPTNQFLNKARGLFSAVLALYLPINTLNFFRRGNPTADLIIYQLFSQINMDYSPSSLLQTPRSTPATNPNPSPASSINPNPCIQSRSTQVTPKSVEYKGVWLKKGRDKKGKDKRGKKEQRNRYATQISYDPTEGSSCRIWLGTFDIPVEAALAYDLAAFRTKKIAPDRLVGDRGAIQAPLPLSRQEQIRRKVDEVFKAKETQGESSNQVGKNQAEREKKIPEGTGTAALSGSEVREQ